MESRFPLTVRGEHSGRSKNWTLHSSELLAYVYLNFDLARS
jgi:hypothetical protein